MLYLGADHAGYRTKEYIRRYLDKQGIPYKDMGTLTPEAKDDYPDYAAAVAKEVSKSSKNRGILVCGSGTGMVIAANRHRKIRAAMVYDRYSAEMSRKDNDANIITLRGRFFSMRKALGLVRIWLATEFTGEKRHLRRIRKLSRIR